jgi:hypothetical protein
MKLVKVSGLQGDPQRWGSLLRQSPDSKGVWGDCRFVFNEDIPECDYWVVYDQMPKAETCRCPKKNTIFITGEPPMIGAYPQSFLNQFGLVITCHKDIAGLHMQEMHPWIVNRSYDELKSMLIEKKYNMLSLITTKKHKRRHNAALTFQKAFPYISMYGDGINTVWDKWDAHAAFRYSIVMENQKTENYFTEKLTDCYLAWTYPFYYGCSNIEEYFPKGSYTEIDIEDAESAVNTILKTIANPNHYPQSLSKINSARELCLDYYNFYPSIIRAIETIPAGWKKETVTISDKGRFVKDKTMFLKKIYRMATGV